MYSMLSRWFVWTCSGWLVAAILLAARPASSAAAPYRPTDDAEVLETLPRVLSVNREELARLRRDLERDPTNPDLAARLAGYYALIGTRESDPRYFGYARAALGPWWAEDAPPPAILRLRAKLQERDHDYEAALRDQRRLLDADPRDVQAWVEIANILWVQGRYDEAREACRNLAAFAPPLTAILCRTQLQSVTGEAEAAYDALTRAIPIARRDDPRVVQFMLTSQAVIAEALGNDEAAERHFREAVENDPGDQYLLRAFADFLLDHGRPGEVVALVRDHVADQGLLLRGTIAAARAGDAQLARRWRDALASQFEETRLRGSLPHGRYEARFMLEIEGRPVEALKLALENWEGQKQSRDTRNVLEAALAADQPEAARPVIEFLETHHTEDVQLAELVRRLQDR